MAKNYKKLRKIFADDAEMLRSLEAEEQAELLGKIAIKENTIGDIARIIKGDPGEKGDTPTEEEVLALLKPFIPEPIKGEDGYTPVKDIDYFDGKDGYTPIKDIDYFDGKNGNDGSPDTPKDIANKLNTLKEVLEPSVIKGYENTDEIIKKIKKQKLEMRDIKDMPLNMADLRWHGGGISDITGLVTAGTGIGVAGTGTSASPYVISNTGVLSVNTLTGAVTLAAGTGISLTPAGNTITIAATGDQSVTLADISANSLTTPNSLYTMTSTIPIEFRSSDGNEIFYIDETNEKIRTRQINITGLTASEIVITDASKNLASAPVATYPSLTELTYLKGVTSAIQTQLDAKIDGSGTATRVAFFSDSNTLTSDADMTFATDTLSVTKLLAPTSVSTPSLISTTALTITPLAGQNLNVALSTTGDFAVNTDQLYVDTSAGFTGINTGSPESPLHAVGGTTMTNGYRRTATLEAAFPVLAFKSTSGGSKWGGIGYDNSSPGGGFSFWALASTNDVSASTVVMNINNQGAVGIGPGNALERLHVFQGQLAITAANATSGYALTAGANNGDYGAVGYNTKFGAGYTAGVSDVASILYFDGGGFTFKTSAGASAGGAITFTNSVSILQSGYMGVGVTSPSARFEVDNKAVAQSIFVAKDNGTDVFTIADGGNVGIGTTNPNAGKLQIGATAGTAIATYGANLFLNENDVDGPNAVGGLELATHIGATTEGYGGKLYSNNSGGYIGLATRYGSATWTERMVIKEQTGNVGIGTTGPQAALHVKNPAAQSSSGSLVALFDGNITSELVGAGPYVQFTSNGTNMLGKIWASYQTSDNVDMIFQTYNSGTPLEAMRLTDSGNVGIGTTEPGTKLEVLGGRSMFQAGSELFAIGAKYVSTTGAFYMGATNAANADGVFSNGAGTALVTMKYGGNVGIGTTVPSQKLEVAGNAYISGILYGAAAGSAAAPSFTFAGDDDTGIYRPSANTFSISTAGTFRMTVDSSGLVGINTASPSSYGGKLVVYHPDNGFNSGINIVGTGDSGAILALQGNGGTTPNKYIRAYNGGLQILNSAINASIFDLTDAGFLGVGNITPTRTLSIKAGASTGLAQAGGVIFDHFTDSTVGGAETDIYTNTLPASMLATNGDKVTASYGGNFVTVGTELTQLKVYFGGTAIWDSTGVAPTTGTTSWNVDVKVIRVSATVVRYTVTLNTTGASGFVYAVSGELTGLTLSGTNVLKITGTSSGVGSGSGDIVGKMGYGEWKSAL